METRITDFKGSDCKSKLSLIHIYYMKYHGKAACDCAHLGGQRWRDLRPHYSAGFTKGGKMTSN